MSTCIACAVWLSTTTRTRLFFFFFREGGTYTAHVQPIQQFSDTKGKNALDMYMAIDAMDLLYTEKVDCFAPVTKDSDFTPLVIKLLSKGKTVIGFGESKTPEPFVKACSVFIHTDDFEEPAAANPQTSGTTRKTKKELRGDLELLNVLRAAVESMKDENRFASMTRIGQYISNHLSLSSKNYGYAQWSVLFRATEYFEESVGEPPGRVGSKKQQGTQPPAE